MANHFWISPRQGIEAWSSAWIGRAQPRHSHGSYQVSLGSTAAGAFIHQGRKHPCGPGEVVILAPGAVHEVVPDPDDEWRFDTLYLAPEAIRGMLDGPNAAIAPDAIRLSGPALASAFARLHRVVATRGPLLEQEDGLLELLSALDRGAGGASDPGSPAPPNRSALGRVRDYLDECPEDGISLEELGLLADLSPSHLSRSFRREFGLPPHAYLMQARVERARALLRRGHPVVEVAARAGFADQAHLTRIFRRLVGVTPGRYLAEGRIVQDPGRFAPYPDRGH